MISKQYASQILNGLFHIDTLSADSGTTNTYPYKNLPLYIGLCKNAPNSTSGSLLNAGEPQIMGPAEYARVPLTKDDKSGTKTYYKNEYFEASPNNGIIQNNLQEIQFNTALKDYFPEDPENPGASLLKYWFLTVSAEGGNAFLQGKINDVLVKLTNSFTFVEADSLKTPDGKTLTCYTTCPVVKSSS